MPNGPPPPHVNLPGWRHGGNWQQYQLLQGLFFGTRLNRALAALDGQLPSHIRAARQEPLFNHYDVTFRGPPTNPYRIYTTLFFPLDFPLEPPALYARSVDAWTSVYMPDTIYNNIHVDAFGLVGSDTFGLWSPSMEIIDYLEGIHFLLLHPSASD